MKAIEKLMIDHPELFEEGGTGIEEKCPYDYKYFNKPYRCYREWISCKSCWNAMCVDEPETSDTEGTKEN